MREPLLAQRTNIHHDGDRHYVYRLRVVGGLSHLSGNARPYFSITADQDRRNVRGGGWHDDAGGCLHDEIERAFPGRFSDLIALHLSDDIGAPMHAEANGWYSLAGSLHGLGETYHAGNSKRQVIRDGEHRYDEPTADECLESFARHCRITFAEAESIRDAVRAAYQNAIDVDADYPEDAGPAALAAAKLAWGTIMETMRDRWQMEADECIARHGLKVYGDGAAVSTS